MKRLILIFSLLSIVFCASAQEHKSEKSNRERINTFIESHRADKSITTIEVTAEMTKILAAKLRESGNESAKLMESIHSMQIVIHEGGSKEMIKDMRQVVDDCKSLKLVSSIEKICKSSYFYFDSKKEPQLSEFLMVALNSPYKEAPQYIMLYITGCFSVTDISTLSSLSDGVNRKDNSKKE